MDSTKEEILARGLYFQDMMRKAVDKELDDLKKDMFKGKKLDDDELRLFSLERSEALEEILGFKPR